MTDIRLSYYERISIWNVVGNYQAPKLKDVAVLLRVMEKVRPTDREMEETELIAREAQMSWKLPQSGYGDRDVLLEDEEAAALTIVLEGIENVRVADAAWICKVVDRLLGQPVT